MPGTVISFVTTAPAPITAPEQIWTGRIVAFEPIVTLSSIMVLPHEFGSALGEPSWNKSLANITPWPMKQSLPIVTNSQTGSLIKNRTRK